MELTRKQVINTLETLKLEWGALAPPVAMQIIDKYKAESEDKE